jgi:hypothetical protein
MDIVPVVKAFLVCDYVIHESGTNKKSCIGIFHNIRAGQFPCRHGQLSIYANIAEAEGKYVFELLLVNLKDGKILGSGQTPELEVPHRLHTAELAFQLHNIVFPSAGKYEFRLIANGDLIAQKVIEIESGPEGEQEEE